MTRSNSAEILLVLSTSMSLGSDCREKSLRRLHALRAASLKAGRASARADEIVTCKPDRLLAAGAEAICTITVGNLGPSAARAVQMIDTHLSNGTFTFGAGTTSQGPCSVPANPQVKSGTITCALGTVGPGATVIISAPISATTEQDINDIAGVSSPTSDPNPDNNQASDGVSIRPESDLSVTKSDAPDPVVDGTQLTYQAVVNNNGPSDALNVVIEDNVPAGVVINSVTAVGGTCNSGVTCSLGNMAVGATATITIVVKVDGSQQADLLNVARVSASNPDTNLLNNEASLITRVDSIADLSLDKEMLTEVIRKKL